MKKFLMIGVATIALGAGAAALAQNAGGDDAQTGPRAGRDGGQRVERMFERFDADGDGVITKDEIAAGRGGAKRPDRFAEIDADGDGLISADDMVQAAMKRAEARAKRNMAWLDADGDGQLSREEYDAGRRGGMLRRFIRMDENGDGQISRDEVEKAAERRGRRGDRFGRHHARGGQFDGDRRGGRHHAWGKRGWGHHGHDGWGRRGWND